MISGKEPEGVAMATAFAELRHEFAQRVHFVTVDWESAQAQQIRSQFSVCKPPSSVIADRDGHVLEKFEGSLSVEEMRAKLRRVLGSQP